MGKELRMTAQQLSASLSMFYIGYIIMQLPATLYLKRVTARVQLSAALMAWGLFTTLLVLNSGS
jgi:fucose permease